ncbi:hypothetical protein PV336_05820 [Streptomyces sp. MI02-2A]|uniref:hypothetical protein n=2 Tax=Streptomyces TaxID=1883 RepID=UPI00074135B8|nr:MULTISPECIES: hypothetical protein [unclassified Streptomyces]KUJ33741.1 hypothetical protein ADL25_43930 [Streptomyces sp. NRRL F-5122]MDX3258748.1 hypothetical protein [Streptomyces sp. MI02-2A]REE62391.1 hypothetical protein BX257_5009 [Streptomyces sp. 3212.3]
MIILFPAVVVVILLALLSYVVGKRTSPKMGLLIASALVGLPIALLIAPFISRGGASEPSPPIIYGNPYEPGSIAYAQYERGYDFAAALARRGEGPGSGMADDVYRWCKDRLTPAAGFKGKVTTAVMQGCDWGSNRRSVPPSNAR